MRLLGRRGLLTAAILAKSHAVTHHTARLASIVSGDLLYIDGGEITTYDASNPDKLTTVAVPNTISIDLSHDWTNSTVAITTYPKNTPGLQSGALWGSATDDSIYSYDGGVSLAQGDPSSVPANQLLRLSTSTAWSEVTVSGNFSKLVRVQEGIYATGNGLGFALGGAYGEATVPSDGTSNFTGGAALDGLVMYNSTSQKWFNFTDGGTYAGKQATNGVAHFIPNLGPVGLFMPFAGFTGSIKFIPMSTLSVFEPSSQQWRTQQTTGDVPPPVSNPCIVGTPGSNNSYEIFLYGGLQEAKNGVSACDGTVYVLTLPAFHWFKVPTPVLGRFRHSCSMDGSRQMISVGGIVIDGSVNNTSTDYVARDTGIEDPWPNGLGVFDMTALQWASQYQSSASYYTTPDVIKSWIASNGNEPASWDDQTTRSWFQISRTSNDSTPTDSATATSSAAAVSQSNGLSSGAIAGIAVAAVIVGILILVGAWLAVRRSRQRRNLGQSKDQGHYDSVSQEEYAHHGQPAVLGPAGANVVSELPDKPRPHEADTIPLYEMDQTNRPLKSVHEMEQAMPKSMMSNSNQGGTDMKKSHDMEQTRHELE